MSAAGCATTPISSIDQFAARSASNSFEVTNRGIASSGLVLAVAHDRQTTQASCGAHALASIIKYWRGAEAPTGDALFTASPPSDSAQGYALGELMTLARAQGLTTSAVRLAQPDLIAELERGRPVLIPVRMPSAYIEPRTLPGQNVPLIGTVRNIIIDRAGRMAEWSGSAMVSHYLVVVGYESDRFVVVEPIQGYRTISFARLARYRETFNDAALVFSAPTPPAASVASAAH